MVDEEHANVCFAVQGADVSFRYGKRQVLDGLNITVERGIIYGLLGPSGCGKTTLLQCIVGKYKPSSGTIKISPGQKGFGIPGPGVGYMPQDLALYPEISTEETLTYFGRIYQMSDKNIKERIEFLAEFLDIPNKKTQIKKLSGGQQRRVSFASALIHKPPLVLLDEPTVGVDPLLRKSIWDYLQRLATEDFLTIIVTTHYVEEAREANIVGLMREGRLLAEANPEYLITKHQAVTLEDVFLDMCERSEHSKPPMDGNMLEVPMESNQGSCEDIWVPQKPKRPYSNYLRRSKEDEWGHKDGLLNDSLCPDSVSDHKQGVLSVAKKSWVRLGALTKKNFIRVKRNIPFIIAQTICPTLQVIIFCLCIGGEPFDLPLAVVNMETDPSGKSNYFLEHLNPRTIRQIHFTNLTSAIDSVKAGENWGVLHIGPTFTDSLINRHLEGIHADNETIEASSIKLYLDMTNRQIVLALLSKIMDGFQEFARSMARSFHQNPMLAEPPIIVEKPIYGPEKPDFIEFMASGMIVSSTYFMSVSLSTLILIIERKEGLLDRSWVSGVQYWEVILSIMIPILVLLVFQVVSLLVCTFLVFNVPCRGSLLWVIIAIFLVGLEGVTFGLFISSVCSNQNTATMISVGSLFPTVILSGIIWPLEAMPYYLQTLSYCLPLTLILNTVRCVLSRGWSITDHGIWNGYLVALVWIIPVIVISSLCFKYKK